MDNITLARAARCGGAAFAVGVLLLTGVAMPARAQRALGGFSGMRLGVGGLGGQRAASPMMARGAPRLSLGMQTQRGMGAQRLRFDRPFGRIEMQPGHGRLPFEERFGHNSSLFQERFGHAQHLVAGFPFGISHHHFGGLSVFVGGGFFDPFAWSWPAYGWPTPWYPYDASAYYGFAPDYAWSPEPVAAEPPSYYVPRTGGAAPSSDDDYYLYRGAAAASDPGVAEAIGDIERTFRTGDIAFLKGHVPSSGDIILRTRTGAAQPMAASVYLAMTRDALHDATTVRYTLSTAAPAGDGTWRVTGTHRVRDSAGRTHDYPIGFLLRPSNGKWVIAEVSAGPER